jgi:hypothetical protein
VRPHVFPRRSRESIPEQVFTASFSEPPEALTQTEV